MRSNRKHTTEELERYIRFYLEEGKSFQELRKDFGLLLSESTFGQNVLRYQEHGLPGIQMNIASELSHLCGEMSHQMRWEEPQSA